MRSFAIEEPGSPVPALYATLLTTEAPVVIISTSLAETELLAMSCHYYQYQSLHFVHIKVFA